MNYLHMHIRAQLYFREGRHIAVFHHYPALYIPALMQLNFM